MTYYNTKNSQMILHMIEMSRDHMTAEEIYQKMKEISPDIVLATVYNNLNRLTGAGKIRRISMREGPDRYDRIEEREERPHDHLICDGCGKLTDISLTDFSAEIERETGMTICSYDLNIHFLCEQCRKKEGGQHEQTFTDGCPGTD